MLTNNERPETMKTDVWLIHEELQLGKDMEAMLKNTTIYLEKYKLKKKNSWLNIWLLLRDEVLLVRLQEPVDQCLLYCYMLVCKISIGLWSPYSIYSHRYIQWKTKISFKTKKFPKVSKWENLSIWTNLK